ncbi:MAG: ABC transporter ATP-binding protein/permease [Lachnospiraceae bacterium]|nr:ABC transporter ATP-binding protein/permease [Lachnospiraceae bacterium]
MEIKDIKPEEKKEILLPAALKKIVAELGGEKEEVLAFSPTDMNENGAYTDGYLVLTAGGLYTFASESEGKRVHSFKGFLNLKDREKNLERDWKCTRIDAGELKKLTIEPQVACGVLIAEFSDGVEKTVAVFSNLYRKEVHVLQRAFDRNFGEKPEEGKEEEGKEGKRPGPGGPGGHGGPGGPGGDKDEEIYCPKCGMMYPNPDRKVCPRCMDRKSVFIRTFGYFKPYRGLMILMFMIYVAVAGLNLVWPYLNGRVLYDYILEKNNDFLLSVGIKNGDFILALLMVILTMFAARFTVQILTVIQGVFTARIVSGVVRDIKKSIFETMGKLSISFFKNRQTGGLMTRVLRDAERVTGFFIDGFPYIFIHSFTLIATLVMMFSINWKMSLCAVILLPGAFVFSFIMRPKMWTAFGHRHRAERTLNSRVNDNLTGARVVKAFGQEAREEERFRSVNVRLKDSEMSIVGVWNFIYFTFNFTYSIATTLIWILGVYLILVEKKMEFGVLVTFIGYVDQLNGPMNFASHIIRWWSDSMNAAQRMFEIIDAVPEIREDDDPVSMEKPKGEIELRNVTFGYEINRPVLKDISLKIPAGSMLGIVGRSGAGKTTLVNLISRMYDPQEGSILLDGIDIKHISFRDLRRNVAMVSQETYIFMGTIEENIAYANPKATKAEIIRAAKLASAHEFILRMPDGYNTVVGSSGRELSGGERQRISIARAILANPKILILDEATASVDTETERAIQAAINYLVKDRTTISIAHRLSTLRDADFLCVLDNGEITEKGTHKELEELHGTYYKLMELQTKALALKE